MVSKSNQNTRGFTIMETMVATGILVAGLVTIASLFTTSINTNLTNRQRTAASLLLVDKLEQFRVTPLGDPAWTPGGALTTDSPIPGYSDTIVAADGQSYDRVWQISGASTRTVTVVVCAERAGLSGRRTELVRATTILGPSF